MSNFRSPIRTCLGCGAKKPQNEMVRFAAQNGGAPAIDLAGKKPGRGAYLCRNLACAETALKRRALERALKLNNRQLTADFIEEVRKAVG